MRRRGRTHRRTDGVDGGVDGFGHGGDRDGEAKWRQLGQRRCRERRPVGTGEAGRRVRAAVRDGTVGTAFKPPGAFGHRHPQHPIGARCVVTLPLIGGPDADSGG
jgi:hypothetical protein